MEKSVSKSLSRDAKITNILSRRVNYIKLK